MLCWSLLSRFLSLWAGLGFVLSYSSTASAPPLIWQIGATLWHQPAFPAPLTGMCHLLPQQETFCHIRNMHLCVALFVHDNMDAKSVYPQCVCVCTLLSLPQPPDPPVSIATGPPVVIVTITPTSLLLWRAKVCFSTPSHLILLLTFLLFSFFYLFFLPSIK